MPSPWQHGLRLFKTPNARKLGNKHRAVTTPNPGALSYLTDTSAEAASSPSAPSSEVSPLNSSSLWDTPDYEKALRTHSPVSPLDPNSSKSKEDDISAQMVPTYQPTRGGSLDQLADSMSPSSTVYLPRGPNVVDETDSTCESPSHSPALRLQLSQRTVSAQAGHAGRQLDSLGVRLGQKPSLQTDNLPQGQRLPADRRLRSAASSPSLTTRYHHESGLQEMPQDLRRAPGIQPVRSQEYRLAQSPLPAPDKPLPQTPAQPGSAAASQSQHYGARRERDALDSPFALPTQHDGDDPAPHGRVPRTDFANADAASRTQDIIEILDTVLWLAKTHNGAGLRNIARYTSNFRAGL